MVPQLQLAEKEAVAKREFSRSGNYGKTLGCIRVCGGGDVFLKKTDSVLIFFVQGLVLTGLKSYSRPPLPDFCRRD
jgi:hypothetical protein